MRSGSWGAMSTGHRLLMAIEDISGSSWAPSWLGNSAFMRPGWAPNAAFDTVLGRKNDGKALLSTIFGRCRPVSDTSSFCFPFNSRSLLLGQGLCALGQPLLVNCTSEMGADWFQPSDRPAAAMISNLMNFVGGSLSFVLPPLFVDENPSDFVAARCREA